MFDEADPSATSSWAPRLPVPKRHKWNSVVYLHGKIEPGDPDGEHLVLTSADFGAAYLVERWASRFVTELFRNFTVVFVGYGVNDPVMRYLMDALAAERAAGVAIRPAYALVEDADDARAKWEIRSVTPIFYDAEDGHSALHNSLRAWADQWSGGLESRIRVVRDRLCWAIADEAGAKALASAGGKRGSTDWLEVFDRRGLLAGAPGKPIQVPLVGSIAARQPPLDEVRFQLARWAAAHLRDPKLASWAIRSGGRLHPDFARLIRAGLREPGFCPPALRKIWLVLTGSIPLDDGFDTYHQLGLHERAACEPWSPLLRADLLQTLAPRLKLHPGWRWLARGLDAGIEGEGELRIDAILGFDCELGAGGATEMLLTAIRGRPDSTSILRDIAFEITAHLRSALEYFAALDRASRDGDTSYIEHPSIEDHDQNRHHHGWTHLIDLARDSFLALIREDEAHARALVQFWQGIEFPLFRRLVLFAARRRGFTRPADLLGLVIAEPRVWIWAPEVQRELPIHFPQLVTAPVTAWGDARS